MSNIAFEGEFWLLGWRETHNGGATVTFQLSDPDELDAFRGMTIRKGKTAGQRLAAVLVEIGDDEKPASESNASGDARAAADGQQSEAAGLGAAAAPSGPAKSPNALAQRMHIDGYFRNPRLWRAMAEAGIYTEIEHKRWIESQPCLLTGRDDRGACLGDIVLHHCKSAATPASGGGENPQKPPAWYGVPLCAIGHHQNWAHASHGASREDKQALLERAVAITAERMKERMKVFMGLKSLSDITPGLLAEFEAAVGLS